MKRCASCSVELSTTTRDRAYPGPVAFCTKCPRAMAYGWDRWTVGSHTGFLGGQVYKLPTADEQVGAPADGDA